MTRMQARRAAAVATAALALLLPSTAASAAASHRASAGPFHKIAGGFQTVDSVNGLKATFTKAGATISPGGAHSPWSLALGLAAVTRHATAGPAPKPVKPVLKSGWVQYHLPSATEMFGNGPGGLQLELLLPHSPSGSIFSPVRLYLRFRGLTAQATPSGRAVQLRHGKTPVLTFSEFGAMDTGLTDVTSSLQPSGKSLELSFTEALTSIDALATVYPVTITAGFEVTEASGTALNATDYLGWSVALSADGSTELAGAPGAARPNTHYGWPGPGSAEVLSRKTGSLAPVAKLQPSDLGPASCLGYSVALDADGGIAAAGAPGCAYPDSSSGAAYVFARAGSGYAQVAELQASDHTAGDMFGSSLAVTAGGSRIVVGAPSSGNLYVFNRVGSTYDQVQELTPGQSGGTSLALSSDGAWLFVGAPQQSYVNQRPQTGVVYIFQWNGSQYVSDGTVQEPDPASYDEFGSSVASSADGSRIVVGAPYHWFGRNPGNETGGGAIYVFERQPSGYAEPSDGGEFQGADVSNAGGEEFGASVAMSGDGRTIVAGAPGHPAPTCNPQGCNGINGPGSAYIFAAGPFGYEQQAEFDAYDGVGNTVCRLAAAPFCGEFGASVVISSNGALTFAGAPTVTTDAGSVYLLPTPSLRFRPPVL